MDNLFKFFFINHKVVCNKLFKENNAMIYTIYIGDNIQLVNGSPIINPQVCNLNGYLKTGIF